MSYGNRITRGNMERFYWTYRNVWKRNKNVLNRSEPDLPECRSDQPHIAQLQTHSHDTALRLDVNT